MLLNIVKDEMVGNLFEMTYNFDPDRWLENEITFLENSYKSGKISELEYEASLEKLNKRLISTAGMTSSSSVSRHAVSSPPFIDS